MKKTVAAILIAVMMLSSQSAVWANGWSNSYQKAITVTLDNIPLYFDVAPIIVNGRTMVPIRVIFEALGADVTWNNNTRTASASKGDKYVSFAIDSYVMYVNGEAKILDVPAALINGRTLVPVRAISEAFGCRVEWDNANRRVSISSFDIDKARSEAEAFASNGDYPSAITTLDNAIELAGYDDELAAKRDAYVDTYVSQTAAAAKAQYIEYDYESIMAAESILETAIDILPDNETLLAELAYYKEREPVRLLDLVASPNFRHNVGTSGFKYVGDKTDVAGITYKNSIAPRDWYENSHPYGWSETYSSAHYSWLLDYQYTKVTGTLFFSEKYKNASIEIELTITPSTGTTRTYFVSNDGQAQHFDVDLTGAKDFEIALRQSEIDGTYAYLADVYIWK